MSKRAAELLRVTARFIRENDYQAGQVNYDDADCDGECLANDCEAEADRIDPPKDTTVSTYVEVSTTTPCCGAAYKDTDHILISACAKCGHEYA